MSWLPKNCVVVPFDFSDMALDALKTARETVDDGAKLHVVHVLSVLEANEPGMIWDAVSDKSRLEHAEAALRKQLPADCSGADVRVVIGDPGHEIVDLAEELSADLIVLSSRGRTGLARLLIGSVAERVVRMAHCPVLVLRNGRAK